MHESYLFNDSPGFVPGQLNLIAVPRWLELSLKAKGVTLEQALAEKSLEGFGAWALTGFCSDILSPAEVSLHRELTCALRTWLFPQSQAERRERDQLYARVIYLWHAIPMVRDLKLNLHPVILGENLIGLYHVEEKPGVTDTDLYGRILRCAHTLAFNKLGFAALGCGLIKDVLYEISTQKS